jgi:hypothetical protein
MVTGKPLFSNVAYTGNYNDLNNRPTIPSGQVNSDWNATSGVAQILNRPNRRNTYIINSLPTVIKNSNIGGSIGDIFLGGISLNNERGSRLAPGGNGFLYIDTCDTGGASTGYIFRTGTNGNTTLLTTIGTEGVRVATGDLFAGGNTLGNARGARFSSWDVDGYCYIDCCGSGGSATGYQFRTGANGYGTTLATINQSTTQLLSNRTTVKELRVQSSTFHDLSGFSVDDFVGNRNYQNFGITSVERGTVRCIIQVRETVTTSVTVLTINHNLGSGYNVQISVENYLFPSTSTIIVTPQITLKTGTALTIRLNAIAYNTTVANGQTVTSRALTTTEWESIYLNVLITGTVFTSL